MIWPVFEEYRAQLASRKLKEVEDAYRDAAVLLQDKSQAYSSIVVDETQDFGPQALSLLRAIVQVVNASHGTTTLARRPTTC